MHIVSRFRLQVLSFVAVLAALFQTAGAHAAHADAVITIPGGVDGTTLTAALLPFVTIAGVAVIAVLSLKFAPLIVRYVYGWVKMAVSRR